MSSTTEISKNDLKYLSDDLRPAPKGYYLETYMRPFKRVLTDTEMKLLSSNPVKLLDKALFLDANKFFVIVSSVTFYKPAGGADYTVTDQIDLYYENEPITTIASLTNHSVFGTSGEICELIVPNKGSVILNDSVYIKSTSDWTTGDNPITVQFDFLIRDLL